VAVAKLLVTTKLSYVEPG